jgi:pimeloyl-ACP methyl ester carboxylesterase
MVVLRRAPALLFLLSLAGPLAAQERIGVVLLHGKWGTPEGYVNGLAQALRGKGMLVATPAMPWARGRDYDADYAQALKQIGDESAKLKRQGATKIVIAGHSLGANAALSYAASGAPADGIVAIAPGHTPERRVFRERLASDVEKARTMANNGKGEERTAFSDLNQGSSATIWTTPRIYLTYFDPQGAAVMPASAARIPQPMALLWITPIRDPLAAAGAEYAYNKAPGHPKSKYVIVESDHQNAPRDATREIVSWIEALGN